MKTDSHNYENWHCSFSLSKMGSRFVKICVYNVRINFIDVIELIPKDKKYCCNRKYSIIPVAFLLHLIRINNAMYCQESDPAAVSLQNDDKMSVNGLI